MQNAVNELIFFGISGKLVVVYSLQFDASHSTQYITTFNGQSFNGSRIWFNWMHHMHMHIESLLLFCSSYIFLYLYIYSCMIISFSTKTILLHILKYIGPEEKAICLCVCECVFYNISPSRAAHVGCWKWCALPFSFYYSLRLPN